MAKKVEIDIILNSADSTKKLRELKQALKEVPAGSAEWKKIYGEIDDLEDRLKGAKQGTDDWVDSLQNAGGPLGLLGRGINQTKVAFSSFNTALKASIIGLIASAVAGLVAAFSQSEVAMKKLQPIFIAFERILGGIFRAMEPLLDIFIEMVMSVLPPLTKGIGIFYSTLFGLFTLIKEVGVGIGKTLKGIFTFDWDSITEGVSQAANGITTALKAGTQAYDRFNAGTKELTKTEKEQLAERNKNASDAAKKREEQRQKELEKQKADLDAKIKLETDKENTSQKELKKLLDQRLALELQNANLTEAQKEVIRKEYEKRLADALKEDETKRQEEEKKKLEKRAKELDALIQLEIDSTDTKQTKLKELLDEKMNQELADLELSEAQKQVIREKYAKQLKDAINADEETRKKKRLDDLAIELQNAQGGFDAQIQVYRKYLEQVLNDEKYQGEEKVKIVRETNDKIRQLNLQQFQQEEQIRQQRVASQLKATEAIIGLTNNETAVGRAALVAKQIILARELFLEAKRTISFSTAAIARSKVAVAEGTAQTAKVGFPQNIPLLILYAAQAVGIIKAVLDATKLAKQAGDTGSITSSPAGTNPPTPPPPPPINVNARRFQRGGLVQGPGTETSDSIAALLSDGEFVVNARSTRLFQPLLSAINDFGTQPQFAAGGMVNVAKDKRPANDSVDILATAITDTLSAQPIRTYVTSADISNQQQFDRIIKSRSLI